AFVDRPLRSRVCGSRRGAVHPSQRPGQCSCRRAVRTGLGADELGLEVSRQGPRRADLAKRGASCRGRVPQYRRRRQRRSGDARRICFGARVHSRAAL
ncbi:MAG: hypothetical protein AVDCRST_MAG44-651, partial [uncultured Sphingomonas sp.]